MRLLNLLPDVSLRQPAKAALLSEGGGIDNWQPACYFWQKFLPRGRYRQLRGRHPTGSEPVDSHSDLYRAILLSGRRSLLPVAFSSETHLI
ncbi:MAG: hypothetical protein KME26_16220 [Oscillatoria princeps RMCB-10]|nr:hypothetical protein [Oscillatoria princeps RMCB-10]